MKNLRRRDRTTWTIDPDHESESLMDKAITRICGKTGNRRGVRTRIILDALKMHLATMKGKREA